MAKQVLLNGNALVFPVDLRLTVFEQVDGRVHIADMAEVTFYSRRQMLTTLRTYTTWMEGAFPTCFTVTPVPARLPLGV